MTSQQKNSMNLSKVKSLFDNYTYPTVKKKIKEDSDLINFIMMETGEFPEGIGLMERAKALATDNPCKCKNCDKVHGKVRSKYCSVSCREEYREDIDRQYRLERTIKRADEAFKNSTENVHYVVCLECGCKTYNLEQHLTLHLMDIEEYKNKYPECITFPSIKSERVQGESNPAFDHGGKYSSFSKKFVKYNGKSEEEVKEEINGVKKKSSETKKLNPHNESTKIEYYLSRGMSMEEAKQALHDRQSTFSLEKLISKYGEEEGTKRWKDRQDRWLSTLNDLPEEEKIIISAKKGFWRYTDPKTDRMIHDEFNKKITKFYVIEFKPADYNKSFLKIGVTSKYLTQRFPSCQIKNVFFTHESDRFTNYHIERDVKKFIFENNLSILVESEDRKFAGWTECVDIENKDLIMEAVYEAIRENISEV